MTLHLSSEQARRFLITYHFRQTDLADCSAHAYQTEDLQAQAVESLAVAASQQPGDGYTVTGDPHVPFFWKIHQVCEFLEGFAGPACCQQGCCFGVMIRPLSYSD